MMSFSLDYLLRQVVVSGKENAVDVTPSGSSFLVTMSRTVLGIEHSQEAMSGSLTVDGHELCDPRAARLNNRNPVPEGCNFQSDRFEIVVPRTTLGFRDSRCLRNAH